MKKKLYIILILVSVITAFTGVIIWGVLQEQQTELTENTVIEVSGETKKTVKAELVGFYPSSKQTYTITLAGETSQDYLVTINFRDDNKSGGLENYLIVTITTKEVTIEKPLKEFLKGEKVELGKNANEITITYAMPEDTGNEAQGTTADFYIDLTAENDNR